MGKALTLGEVYLEYCSSVGDTAIRVLAALPALSTLQIDSTKVTDTGLTAISTHATSLRYLSIKGCAGVTDQGVQTLAALGNLRKLDMTDCPNLTQQCVASFSKLPAS